MKTVHELLGEVAYERDQFLSHYQETLDAGTRAAGIARRLLAVTDRAIGAKAPTCEPPAKHKSVTHALLTRWLDEIDDCVRRLETGRN